MLANVSHEVATVRGEGLNLVEESKARPAEVGMRKMTALSSAGFAGATGSWRRVWEGAVEAPFHELEAIVESAETGHAVDVGRER